MKNYPRENPVRLNLAEVPAAPIYFRCSGRDWNSAEMVTIRPRNQRYGCAIRILAMPDCSRVFVSSDEFADEFHEADDAEREALAERFGLEQLRTRPRAMPSNPTPSRTGWASRSP